jgi:hypothetical protein
VSEFISEVVPAAVSEGMFEVTMSEVVSKVVMSESTSEVMSEVR